VNLDSLELTVGGLELSMMITSAPVQGESAGKRPVCTARLNEPTVEAAGASSSGGRRGSLAHHVPFASGELNMSAVSNACRSIAEGLLFGFTFAIGYVCALFLLGAVMA
jgi:hypothetical protein